MVALATVNRNGINVVGIVTVLYILNSLELLDTLHIAGGNHFNLLRAIPQGEFTLVVTCFHNVADNQAIGNRGGGHLVAAQVNEGPLNLLHGVSLLNQDHGIATSEGLFLITPASNILAGQNRILVCIVLDIDNGIIINQVFSLTACIDTTIFVRSDCRSSILTI